MTSIIALFLPILTLIIISSIKLSEGKLELRGIGLDFHVIGIMYFCQVIVFSPYTNEINILILMIITLTFTLNAICYLNAIGRKCNRKIWAERIGFTIGLIVFFIGIISTFF
jgi:hypothetical protein